MKKYSLIIVAALLALLLGGTLWLRWQALPTTAALPAGTDFVLQSADGPVDTKNLRGKVLLVFFGYTNCPDICPASLSAGALALNALTPGERERVRLLMVSVDPERDTPQRLKEYTAYFHPAMTGVTGSPAEIARIAGAFGAGYGKQPARTDGAYAVDHTASTFLVNGDGRLAAVLDLGTPTEQVVAAIRAQL